MAKNIFKQTIIKILTWESRMVLFRYKPQIIAVTGSVGKTSTKDAIFTALSGSFSVRKSEKSFNGDIGVPLTILGLPNAWNNPLMWIKNVLKGFLIVIFHYDYPEWLVLEVGADRPGDIRDIAKWVHPDVVVMTRFAKVPVHIEFFKSREHVIEEKGYLAKALKPGGTLVINADDPDMEQFNKNSRGVVISVGTGVMADVVGSHTTVLYENDSIIGTQFRVDYQGNSVPVSIHGALGKQQIYPALFAFAVGISRGINMVTIGDRLLSHKTPNGRMHLVPGIKKTMIIDDTYNASPVAVDEALLTLGELKVKGRRIAVLGDMMELGKHSVEMHREIGVRVSKSADLLIAVGIRARGIADSALDIIGDEKVLTYDSGVEVLSDLQNLLKEGDIVLVKGSQSMRMERIVKGIMAEPEKAGELLVRQEEEWFTR
jgi:UDP-N-acetylmuramoyl-tripeptide--D-alanyl-D-alanine ligase